MRLVAGDIFEPGMGFHVAVVSGLRTSTEAHDHDFAEVFLITRGTAVHHVNGVRQVAPRNRLVFVRPEDRHCYELDEAGEFEFLNIAFTMEVLEGLKGYLGYNELWERLWQPGASPVCGLAEMQKEEFLARSRRFLAVPPQGKGWAGAELKLLLMELVMFFMPGDEVEVGPSVPTWLARVREEMGKRENFIVGLPMVYKLAGRSQQHVAYTFRKYLGVTPTEFVNELRLNYARSRLGDSGVKVTDVCFEAGFENLSHFHHLFKARYGMPPGEVRRVALKVVQARFAGSVKGDASTSSATKCKV